MTWRLVVIESPFKSLTLAGLEENAKYLTEALHDCVVNHNDSPYASHGLLTRFGVLDDSDPVERKRGIEAGLAFKDVITTTVVYADLGISEGMHLGIERARSLGHTVLYRYIRSEPRGEFRDVGRLDKIK